MQEQEIEINGRDYLVEYGGESFIDTTYHPYQEEMAREEVAVENLEIQKIVIIEKEKEIKYSSLRQKNQDKIFDQLCFELQ